MTRWQTKPLGEIADVIAGQSPEGTAYNNSGQGQPFYQGKKEFGERFIGPASTWTTQVTKLARAGDILMSVRAPVGPVNLAAEECCIGRGLAAIRTNDGVGRDFLFLQLVAIGDYIRGSAGAVFPSISRDQIASIPIAFPPEMEQRRIVGVLDKAFAAIATARANAEKNLQNAVAVLERSAAALLNADGEGWRTKPLGELAERIDEISEQTKKVIISFQQKLAALDELKKSLLHEAFNGRL